MERVSARGSKWRAVAAGLIGLGITALGMRIHSLAADSSTLRIKVGAKAPNFDLAAPDGKRVRLADFTGHNVLIDFYRGYW